MNNLARGWRMVYTLVGNEVEIISIILEWFGHKEYERVSVIRAGRLLTCSSSIPQQAPAHHQS